MSTPSHEAYTEVLMEPAGEPIRSEQANETEQNDAANVEMADASNAAASNDVVQDKTAEDSAVKETADEESAAATTPRRRGRKPKAQKMKRQTPEPKKKASEASETVDDGQPAESEKNDEPDREEANTSPELHTKTRTPRKRGRKSNPEGLDSTAVLEETNASASGRRYALRKRTKPDDSGAVQSDSDKASSKKNEESDTDMSDSEEDETFNPRRFLAERRGAAADIYDFDKQSLMSGVGRMRRTQSPRKSNAARANGDKSNHKNNDQSDEPSYERVRIDEELGSRCKTDADKSALEHFAQSVANRQIFDHFYYDLVRKSRADLMDAINKEEAERSKTFEELLARIKSCDDNGTYSIDTVCLISEHPPGAHDFFDTHVFDFQAAIESEGDENGQEHLAQATHRLAVAYKLNMAQRETLLGRDSNVSTVDCFAVDQRTFRRLYERSKSRVCSAFAVTHAESSKLIALIDCSVESANPTNTETEAASASAASASGSAPLKDTLPKVAKAPARVPIAGRNPLLKCATVVKLSAFQEHTLFVVLASESRTGGRPRYSVVAIINRDALDRENGSKTKLKADEDEEQHAKCSCSLITNDEDYNNLVSAVRAHEAKLRNAASSDQVILEFDQSQLVDESGKPIVELVLSIAEGDGNDLVGVYFESGNAITIPFVRSSALRLERLSVAGANENDTSFEASVLDSFSFDEFVARECKVVQEATVRAVHKTNESGKDKEKDRQVLVDRIKVRCFAHATPERWNEYRSALGRSFNDAIRAEPLTLSVYEFAATRWFSRGLDSESCCSVCTSAIEQKENLGGHELSHLRKALGSVDTARNAWKVPRARLPSDDFDDLFGDNDDVKLRNSLAGTSRQRNLPQLFECEACNDFFSNAAAYADHCMQCDSVSLFAKLVAKITPAGESNSSTNTTALAVSTPFQRTIKKSNASKGNTTASNADVDLKPNEDSFELFNLDDVDVKQGNTTGAHNTSSGSKKQFVCGLCGTQLSTRHKLRQHFLFIHQQCALCLATYVSVDELSAHLQTHYPGTKHKRVLQCEDCSQFYSLNRQNLIHHHFYSHPDAVNSLRQLVLAISKGQDEMDDSVMQQSQSQSQSQSPVRRVHAVAKKGQARKLQEAQSSVDLRDSYYDSSFGKSKMECRHCAQKFACSQTVDYIKHLQAKHAVLNNAANPIQICRICFDYFHSVELLSEHLRLIHVPSGSFKNAGVQTIYECDVCQPPTFFFAFLKQIYQHYFDAHGVGEPRLFRCHLCPKRFHLRKILRSHIERHSEETRYECDFCDKRFAARANLLIHRQIHAEARAVAYVDAGKNNQSSASAAARADADDEGPAMLALGDSTARRGKLKKYECDHCRKRFAHLKNLQQHLLETHVLDSTGLDDDADADADADFGEDLKPDANKSTANEDAAASTPHQRSSTSAKQSKMVVHVPIAQPPVGYHSTQMVSGAVLAGAAWNVSPLTVVKREHVCETCAKTFNSMRELARHCKVQHSGPITCEHCSRTFTNLTMYDAHRKLHTDPPRFICDYCQAVYYEKAALIKHIRAEHLRLEPERRECPICRKHVSQLRMHLATHDSPRYECGRCGRRFTKSAYYNEHIRTHLDDTARPFACAHCPRTFNKKSNLNLHLRRVHPDEDRPLDDADSDADDLKFDQDAPLFADPLDDSMNGTSNGNGKTGANRRSVESGTGSGRKRGRPKKIKEPAPPPPQTDDKDDVEEEPPAPTVSAKKGRGRPKLTNRPVVQPASASAVPNKVMPSRASKSRAQEKITQSFIEDTDTAGKQKQPTVEVNDMAATSMDLDADAALETVDHSPDAGLEINSGEANPETIAEQEQEQPVPASEPEAAPESEAVPEAEAVPEPEAVPAPEVSQEQEPTTAEAEAEADPVTA